MKILFVHQHFPGQYLHLARFLGANKNNEVMYITQRKDAQLPGVQKVVYQPTRKVTEKIHHYLTDAEAGILNGQQVARAAFALKKSGFVPDVMLGHNGWGEIWYLKDVFPSSPLIGYFEFYYKNAGSDVGFDPENPTNLDTLLRVRTKNFGNLLGLDTVDAGQCPTEWQKSLYPKRFKPMLHVAHEGIDTTVVVPNAKATLRIKDGVELSAGEEIVTYVSRNLEPYRGFKTFMRSLPAILKARPKAQIVIVGGDDVSYGARLPKGQTFRQQMLYELGDSIDVKRVHFLGKVDYSTFLKVLQISRVHVYLTFPFVLSWSMLEAMSAGCLIVGSKTPPVEEVIQHGENGVLVDFFSHEQVASRVVEALESPKAFASIRRAARETIEQNYDLKRICLPAHLRLIRLFSKAN